MTPVTDIPEGLEQLILDILAQQAKEQEECDLEYEGPFDRLYIEDILPEKIDEETEWKIEINY